MKHLLLSCGVSVGLLLSGVVGVAQTVAFDSEISRKAGAADVALALNARAGENLLVLGTVPSPILIDTHSTGKPAGQSSLSVAPIPEPSMYAALLGLAVLGVAGLRRWTRRSSTAG